MTPLGPQLPPRAFDAGQTNATGPPESGVVFSCSSAKKPIERLSGDQNGANAPSVPGMNRDSSLSRGRTEIRDTPSSPAATTARCCPSGETTAHPSPPEEPVTNLSPSGSDNVLRIVRAGGGDFHSETMPAMTTKRPITASAHGTHECAARG